MIERYQVIMACKGQKESTFAFGLCSSKPIHVSYFIFRKNQGPHILFFFILFCFTIRRQFLSMHNCYQCNRLTLRPYFPSKEKLCNVVSSTPWHISFASVDISAKNCFNVLFQKLKTNGETKICKYWICIGGKPCANQRAPKSL